MAECPQPFNNQSLGAGEPGPLNQPSVSPSQPEQEQSQPRSPPTISPQAASPKPQPAMGPLQCPALQLPSPRAEQDDSNSLSSPGSSMTLSPRAPTNGQTPPRQNHVSTTMLHGVPIVCLLIDGKERLCLAQISTTLLKPYSYNEIHNRRVALGITCVQCTPVQLEILRRAGAMPISSRRCGMITKREAERLVKSFLDDTTPPKLPDNFAFDIKHECGWGSRGSFIPSRYNSSRAKCIKCSYCNMYFSPNKFIFHFHRTPESKYHHPDAANFNSWRRHITLNDARPSDDLLFAWEDVKAMFNGGTRKRVLTSATSTKSFSTHTSTPSSERRPSEAKRPKFSLDHVAAATTPRLPPPSPLHYPMFSKMLPSPGGVKAMPMFTMPPFSMDKPPMRPPPPNMKPPEVSVPNMHDTLYPPYEMIWAKHLGLTNTDSTLVPSSQRPFIKQQANPLKFPPNLSPSKPSTNFTAQALIDSSRGEAPLGLLSGNGEHMSAFTRVGNTRKSDSSDIQDNEMIDNDDDESDNENVDVDTIDEACSEQCETNNNNDKSSTNNDCHSEVLHSEDDDEDEDHGDDDRESEMEERADGEMVVQNEWKDEGMSPKPVKDSSSTPPPSQPPCVVDMSRTTPKDGVYRDFSQLSKEQLQEELLIEIQVRKKMEEDCQTIKETFQGQVDREKQYREEMSRQLQIVRESLCQELDQERKARFTLQQKLKEAHDALHNFSCKMLASRQCAECAYKEPMLPR